jgi:hypothetical protein
MGDKKAKVKAGAKAAERDVKKAGMEVEKGAKDVGRAVKSGGSKIKKKL